MPIIKAFELIFTENNNAVEEEFNYANQALMHRFVFRFQFDKLTEIDVQNNSEFPYLFDSLSLSKIQPKNIEVNAAIFDFQSNSQSDFEVSILQNETQIITFCNCGAMTDKLCEHQAKSFVALLRRDELGQFFIRPLRLEVIRQKAIDYGLENEIDLEKHFKIELHDKITRVIPINSALISVTPSSLKLMRETIAGNADLIHSPIQPTIQPESEKFIVVFRKHKHYGNLVVELYSASINKDGGIKNPLKSIDPMELIWETDNSDKIKFYAAIQKFKNISTAKRSKSELKALLAIIANPENFEFYCQTLENVDKINVAAIKAIGAEILKNEVDLSVEKIQDFYQLSGNIEIKGQKISLNNLVPIFSYFVLFEEALYLVNQIEVLGLIDLFQKKEDKMLIHASKFSAFKMQFLHDLEEKFEINYKFIKTATKKQLLENLYHHTEKLIYLSDFGAHVMIIPVVRYGEIEIQLRTKKNIFATDKQGNDFLVKRDVALEINFESLLIRQHPQFAEQLENGLTYYYLHKTFFLDEHWFLNVFEAWQQQQITILGFNEIEGNKINQNKISIDIKVLSGINWFNTLIDVKYGSQKVSLKHLHKAIRNKSKFVRLADGTEGLLPAEWIEKFKAYFNASEITEAASILIPKVNFAAIENLFEPEMFATDVKTELQFFKERLSNPMVTGFNNIQSVKIPTTLNATLRPYQKEGLNWLNFLDDFNFGGCLADEMGLGKSIQIIAFILLQREKVKRNTNLLVVPATLIFNWQKEVEKFAPTIKILKIHGGDRQKNIQDFEQYELIITSYGTLLSDQYYLKNFEFNYIFLDESQNIKNPNSERYKAVKTLKSRNKIAITGTPIENNTFDLYSQFSFACPGLLGSKQYFKDVYSIPIDTFKETRRAQELQEKIRPFLLRRTKQEVAKELPEKTEMVLYCEMDLEQRRIYNAYEKEFREYISATTNEELNKNSMNVLKGLTKLRQICDSPKLLGSDALTGDIPSKKIEMLMDQIENKPAGQKILVFSQFVSMLDLIAKELDERNILHLKLTGKTRNREKVVGEFQTNPAVKVFLISLKAGGTGLNLTEAESVYLVDPWWNPAVENQAIDRIHRIGQRKNVLAVRMICPDTIEEKIMLLQASKKELSNDLISSDMSFLKNLSKIDLLRLL